MGGEGDAFLLLGQPAAGDDLQSIKRGILELADHIAVNKVDKLPTEAKQTARELRMGLHLAPARQDDWAVQITTCSAETGQGLEDIRHRLEAYRTQAIRSGRLPERRREQTAHWLGERVWARLRQDLERHMSRRGGTTDELMRIIDEAHSLSAATDVLIAQFYQQHKPLK